MVEQQLITTPTDVPPPGATGAVPVDTGSNPTPATGEIVVDGVPRRRLRGTDVHVYPVALGGSTFGWTADAEATSAILDNYADAGGNYVSVSDHYSSGRSEVMLGNWLRRTGRRDQMIVATTAGRAPEFADGSAASIVAATEASLQRLGIDHVDLLGLYGVDESVRIEEALAAAEQLIAAGKVRHLIANDYSADRLLAARITAAHLGAPQFVAVKTTYNLVNRKRYENQIAAVAGVQNLSVIPKHALGNGFLTGRFRVKDQAMRSARGANAARYLNRSGLRILSVLETIGAEHDKPMSTIALAWLLTKRQILAPVVSAASPDHVAGLTDAAMIRLSRHQITQLDNVSAW